jgi:hypothetical protein
VQEEIEMLYGGKQLSEMLDGESALPLQFACLTDCGTILKVSRHFSSRLLPARWPG